MMNRSKICLVHDYLIQMGGAERVVATMAKAFPQAPIFTSLTEYAGLLEEFKGREIHNSFLQRVPGARSHFKKLFPLYPMAFASLNLPATRTVWVSASTFAKCVRPPEGAVSFCYCHNPTRFLWDNEDYVNAEVRSPVLRKAVDLFAPALRKVDFASAKRMNYLIANSENVRHRIERIYKRPADVIHPPVGVETLEISLANRGYYVIVSRLIGYKRIDLAVQAFAGFGRELRVVGDGTDRERLEGMAAPNVKILGRVSEGRLREELAGARALIFPGEEDFGISPVEAQACGKPVIAYAAGGALETVVEGITGVFFHRQEPEALRAAIEESERIPWDAWRIRKHAERFSEAEFLKKMLGYMEERLDGVSLSES